MSERKITEEATWLLELNITCPECNCYFDYLTTEEYKDHDGWEGLKHCESDTDVNIEVDCPECGLRLLVKETSY